MHTVEDLENTLKDIFITTESTYDQQVELETLLEEVDLFVSQVTPLSDSRFAWCLDFSPQPIVAFLNLAGQRKYTTCSMDSKLHFGPFADEEGHTIPFPGSLRR